MLYEVAYPALYLGAKTQQMSRRTMAHVGMMSRDMARVTYHPESYYRVACWRLRRADIALLMRLAPMRAARLTIERFERTKQMPDRKGFESGPEEVQSAYVRYNKRKVFVRYYGPEDGPMILAIHGWNGRASMLRKMVEALVAQGYRVVVPDLPGHGKSEGDRYSFYDLGQALADLFENLNFEAVIGHSAGGLILAIALARGLKAKCFIPVGSPASLARLLQSYVEITQMPDSALPYIARYYTRKYNLTPEEVGPCLISDLQVRTLVVHETSDWQISIDNAHELVEAARESELFLTTGRTHLSVLNAPEVHARVGAFISRGQHA